MRRFFMILALVSLLAGLVPVVGAQNSPTAYVVQPGDSLTAIAGRYGVSIDALAAANNLTVTTRLLVGQRLVIPVPAPLPGAIRTYTVQRGDTLASIAQRFATTVNNLVALNGIANVNRIVVGQVINVPAPAPRVTHYRVMPGDTLFRIATRFGVSVQSIAQNNGILNPNRIFAGQVLRIVY
jgi:peptidoglycan-N-acetylglucosamine deacetylase